MSLRDSAAKERVRAEELKRRRDAEEQKRRQEQEELQRSVTSVAEGIGTEHLSQEREANGGT